MLEIEKKNIYEQAIELCAHRLQLYSIRFPSNSILDSV